MDPRLYDASLVQRKAGRPSLDKFSAQEKANKTIALRSQGCLFNKYLCIIWVWWTLTWHVVYCHWSKNVVHRWKVRWWRSVLQTYLPCYECQQCSSKWCQIYLSSWAAVKQRVALTDKSYASQKNNAKPNVIADIKIIKIQIPTSTGETWYVGKVLT